MGNAGRRGAGRAGDENLGSAWNMGFCDISHDGRSHYHRNCGCLWMLSPWSSASGTGQGKSVWMCGAYGGLHFIRRGAGTGI